LTDCKKQYVKLNAKLEATRKGEKRWGVDWMPAADEDQKQATVDGAKSTIASSTATIQKLDAEIADTQRRKDAVVYTEGNNNQTQKKAAYQKQIDEFNSQRASAQTELEGAQKTLKDTLPKWPENLPLESLTLE
jgi:chromosome segregation ATPase